MGNEIVKTMISLALSVTPNKNEWKIKSDAADFHSNSSGLVFEPLVYGTVGIPSKFHARLTKNLLLLTL